MKKIITCLILCFSLFTALAQDDSKSFNDQGTWMLNGQSSLNVVFSDGTPLLLTLNAGYFVIDNLAAGVGFAYIRFSGSSDTSTSIFARYYLDKFFLQGNLDLDDGSTVTLSAGYELFISNNVSLEPAFNYPIDDFLDPSLTMSVAVFF